MFDFSPRSGVEALVTQVRGFVDEVVIPREADVAAEPGRLESVRAELQQAARAAGVFAPRVPVEYGGLGLDWRDSALVFEAAGRSLLGRRRSTARRRTKATCTCCMPSAAPNNKHAITRRWRAGRCAPALP